MDTPPPFAPDERLITYLEGEPRRKRARRLTRAGYDLCPGCDKTDLEQMGAKHRCPECGYIQPCCEGGPA